MRKNKVTPSCCRGKDERHSWEEESKKPEEKCGKSATVKKVGDYLRKCKAAALEVVSTERKARKDKRSSSVSRLVETIAGGRRRMPRSRSADFSTNNVRLSQLDRTGTRKSFADESVPIVRRNKRFSSSFQTIFEKNEITSVWSGEDLHCETLLTKSTQTMDGSGTDEVEFSADLMKWDLTSIVEVLFQPLYGNFLGSKSVLMRQARDLLLCTYAGNVSQFNEEFCIPAGRLIRRLKHYVKIHGTEKVTSTAAITS